MGDFCLTLLKLLVEFAGKLDINLPIALLQIFSFALHVSELFADPLEMNCGVIVRFC